MANRKRAHSAILDLAEHNYMSLWQSYLVKHVVSPVPDHNDSAAACLATAPQSSMALKILKAARLTDTVKPPFSFACFWSLPSSSWTPSVLEQYVR